MPLPTSQRLARTAAIVAALGLTLAACSGADEAAPPTVASPAPASDAPRLEAEWTIPGLNSNPESVGTHHWLSHQTTTLGHGRASSTYPGPVLTVDARTGTRRKNLLRGDRAPCSLPAWVPDDGLVPVRWIPREEWGRPDAGDCRLAVIDLATGKDVWSGPVDLQNLSREVRYGAENGAVGFVDDRGRTRCVSVTDGARPGPRRACRTVLDRLQQSRSPGFLGSTHGVHLFGEMLEETHPDHGMLNLWLLRAEDATTHETLWELKPDVHTFAGVPWSRNDEYFVTPSGLARVTYDHPDTGSAETDESVYNTPAVVIAVDPRTGEDLHTVARLPDGAWFNHQFGHVLVALTNQGAQLNSTISGFRLPTW